MDRKTKKVLLNIGKSIPKNWIKQGIKEEKTYEFQEEFMIDRSNKLGVGDNKRDFYKKALEDKKIKETHDRVSISVDEKVNRQISEYVDAKVKKAIRSGKIKKAKRDAFHGFVDAHMKPK